MTAWRAVPDERRTASRDSVVAVPGHAFSNWVPERNRMRPADPYGLGNTAVRLTTVVLRPLHPPGGPYRLDPPV